MRHHYLVALLAIAASCSFPQHLARGTYEDTISTAGLRELHCTTHNGNITIQGKPGISEIRVLVNLSVRGYSQDEAAAHLELMEVRHETEGDRLTIEGQYDRSLNGMSPSFSFVLEAPAHLVNKLVSHNGDIRALQTAAALDCETHNGDIEAESTANDVRFVSHNGDMELSLVGIGPLNGLISTHNGDVSVTVANAIGASVSASTHNGSIRLNRGATETSRSKRQLNCRLGNGAGSLEIETHNGNVEIR